MIKLIQGVAIALALMFAPGIAKAADEVCMKDWQFKHEVAVAVKAELPLTQLEKQKMTAQYNEVYPTTIKYRAAVEVFSAVLLNGNIGITMIDSRSCIIEGSTLVMSQANFLKWMKSMGLSFELPKSA